jgi:hypothetical protein
LKCDGKLHQYLFGKTQPKSGAKKAVLSHHLVGYHLRIMNTESIDIWEAIRLMREMSKAGASFSLTYMGWSQDRKECSGEHEIKRCRLRASTPIEKNQYADHMLNLLDLDLEKPSHCWKPLLMYFNGKKINPITPNRGA